MKKITLFVCACTVVNVTFGQVTKILIGKWQTESAEVTSMYHDSYQFFKDGKFAFKPDEYNGLNRIISINGTYKVKGDTLFLIPLFTEEIVGGHFIRSESTTLSDTWEIIGGQEKKVLINKKDKQSGVLKIGIDNKEFTLDDRKFYKVSS